MRNIFYPSRIGNIGFLGINHVLNSTQPYSNLKFSAKIEGMVVIQELIWLCLFCTKKSTEFVIMVKKDTHKFI